MGFDVSRGATDGEVARGQLHRISDILKGVSGTYTHLFNAFENGSLITQVAMIDDALDVPFGLPSESHECLDFAAKENTSIGDGVIQRLDPESVSRSKNELPLDIVEDESKLAAQTEQQVEAIALISAGEIIS